ncbi:hypothetical protein HT031_004649 [Scenedesmus sp. PABB004]|nr:hypothetical protein HT031_004649 [Scenedesmus sp. PABB004]
MALFARTPACGVNLRPAGRLVLLLALAAAGPRGVRAHGMLTEPPSRNWLDWVNNNAYWPDANNAGGYKALGAYNGGDAPTARWPNGKHSLCGDPGSGPQPYMTPGPVVATYKAGQIVELHVAITTNHYGRFTFALCPADATRDEQCTKLQRADGKGVSWDLPAVVEGSRFNGGALREALRPMEVDAFYAWYPMGRVKCATTAQCGRFNGTPVYKLRFKLPPGRTCEKCILQWNYLTGHKCHPPCIPQDRYYPDCRANPKFRGTYLATMDYCGTQWAAYPETFWNCADIAITA